MKITQERLNYLLDIEKKYFERLETYRNNYRDVYERKIDQGEIVTPKAPYGYIKVKKNGKWVAEVDYYESQIVKLLFHSYPHCDSLEELRKNVVWYNKKRRNPVSIPSVSYIAKLLLNPFYIGYQEYNGKKYPHTYEHLVHEEQWHKVQKELDSRQKKNY